MTRRQRAHTLVQLLRRLTQAASTALVFGLVFLALYGHYRSSRAIEDEALTGGWRGKILKHLHGCVGARPDAQHVLDSNKGTWWSMRLGGVDLTDPLAAAESVAASRTVHWPLLLSILIPVLATLLLGRVFCSWICPAGWLFELTGKLRSVLGFLELPPAEVKFSHRNKYVLLGAGLVTAFFAGVPIFALVYPPAVLSRLTHAWIFGTAATGLLVVLGIIVVFEVFVAPRWWCRSACPGGALYALLGAARPLRVRLEAASCTGCKECQPVCPVGINPVTQSAGLECDNCAACIRACPEDALKFSLAKPLLLLLLLAEPAQAHHILGLPHYAYRDSYPQRPVLEYPAFTGPYNVLLQSCPGKPSPGETVILAFYIKDRNTNQPYGKEIVVRVLQEQSFGDAHEVLPATPVGAFEVPQKTCVKFPADGVYTIELQMEVEGQLEVIRFELSVGEPASGGALLASVGGGLVFFIIVVRAIRIKRARRRAARTLS